MAKVIDVAEYILSKSGKMSTWKLQKLVYYSQAWHLVWDDKPLFTANIQAWANGPVVPQLYHMHKGNFSVTSLAGAPDKLKDSERETIDTVLAHYGKKSPDYLSQLTHLENPWRHARKGVPDGERSGNVISHESMAEYYAGL